MLNRLIDFHLGNRLLVLAGLALLVATGLWALENIPIDAFPDLTNNQVTVLTEAPGTAPVEVERLITFPIESALMGLPGTLEIRSTSKLGLSIVTVVFADSVDTYFARQLLNERLLEVRSRIPEQFEPTLGPVATAFGEIYQYTLESPNATSMELKTLHDWELKNQLRAVSGVSEVNTWGGLTQQFQVVVDPIRLRSYGLTLRDVYERIRDNNSNFGGGFIEHGSEQYTVRGLGRVRSGTDLENIVLSSSRGTPVFVRDVAEVVVGALPRQGAVTRNGLGERVSGMVIMLKGENGKRVIERVKQRLEEMAPSLPADLEINPFYDQSEVIDRTIRTVRNNLVEGGLLVILVLFLFLHNVRGALIVAAVIPLSMLTGFLGMWFFGISANLMSLGAIDFGLIVDGSVVMMENSVRRLQGRNFTRQGTFQEIRLASFEVARPIVFGVAIIIAVYLPVLTLQGIEGRMFRPMAVTVCSAILGSLILALTAVPAATAFFIRKPLPAHRERWFGKLRSLYLTFLPAILKNRKKVVATALLIVLIALGSVFFIGTEFMPRLDEGSILLETRKLPSVSLTESIAISTEIEKILLGFPEVLDVVTKMGRPDLATEAMGIYQGDVYIKLAPRDAWTTAATKEGLINALADRLERFPGVAFSFTQPMAMRMDEVISGVKADVAVKIFGEDETILSRKADEILAVLQGVRGAADVQKEVFEGAAEWQIQIDRDELARFGLNVADVSMLVEAAVGGQPVTEVVDGQKRFSVALRIREETARMRETLSALELIAPGGELVPLGRVGEIIPAAAPEVINRESGQRRLVVQSNVRGRDLGSFVQEAQRLVATRVQLPTGYYLKWGGQFENQQRAMARLSLVVPAAILIIFLLLFMSFGSVKQSLLIMLNVPFAAVGGIAALWIRDLNLNLSASVGFIALFGVAVLNGIVLISTVNRLVREGHPTREAVIQGAAVRLRPVLMTALVASLGFVPMATATSAGAEVQRPLATVVIGGLITSTLLTLVVLPALYSIFCEPRAGRRTDATRAKSNS